MRPPRDYTVEPYDIKSTYERTEDLRNKSSILIDYQVMPKFAEPLTGKLPIEDVGYVLHEFLDLHFTFAKVSYMTGLTYKSEMLVVEFFRMPWRPVTVPAKFLGYHIAMFNYYEPIGYNRAIAMSRLFEAHDQKVWHHSDQDGVIAWPVHS